jgi:hypothetical protein
MKNKSAKPSFVLTTHAKLLLIELRDQDAGSPRFSTAPGLSVGEMSELTGISYDRVMRTMPGLYRRGYVLRSYHQSENLYLLPMSFWAQYRSKLQFP